MSDSCNLYEVLGVKREASAKEIRHAFRKKAQKAHPDKGGGSEEAFKRILEAYNVLMDEHLRAYYDATGKIRSAEDEESVLRQLVAVLLHLVAQIGDPAYVDLLAMVKRAIDEGLAKGKRALGSLEKDIQSRQAAASRISVKTGPNLLAEALLSDATRLEAQRGMLQQQISTGERILELLANYSYRVDAEIIAPTPDTSFFRTTTSTRGRY